MCSWNIFIPTRYHKLMCTYTSEREIPFLWCLLQLCAKKKKSCSERIILCSLTLSQFWVNIFNYSPKHVQFLKFLLCRTFLELGKKVLPFLWSQIPITIVIKSHHWTESLMYFITSYPNRVKFIFVLFPPNVPVTKFINSGKNKCSVFYIFQKFQRNLPNSRNSEKFHISDHIGCSNMGMGTSFQCSMVSQI